MTDFQYLQRVPVTFGINSISKLPALIDELGGTRGLLVSSNSVAKAGIANDLVKASNGKLIGIFTDIKSNPTVTNCDNLANRLRDEHCDFVVAIGGGSVLDCAKLARYVATEQGSCTDFLHETRSITAKGLPFIAIPTTSGSASEVSGVSVLTDEAANIKKAIGHPNLYPDAALVDPALTISCPPTVTAISGIDVLAHALEAYYNVRHQPFTDLFAEHAARLVFENLRTAFREPTNIEARSAMAEASVAAGMAFNITGTAAAHACSYPLTQLFDVPHGEACALTLAAFWRLNATADARLETFSKRLGFVSAAALADGIDALKRDLGLRMTLADAGITEVDQLELLISASFAPNIALNPVKMTKDNLRDLYNKILE